MHSNAQLRTVVAKQLAKEDEKYKAKRPDFVCGTVDRKLIIIEREPGHGIGRADWETIAHAILAHTVPGDRGR